MQNNLTIFNTGKVELCFVMLPDDTVHVEVYDKESLPTALMVYRDHKFFKPGWPSPIVLPPGEWQLKGSPFDVTEEEARVLVEMCDNHPDFNFYRDYRANHKNFSFGELIKALESWHSLLSHLQIYKTNPYASEKPITIIGHKGQEKVCEAILERFQKQWEAAESRKGNWVFMIKSK